MPGFMDFNLKNNDQPSAEDLVPMHKFGREFEEVRLVGEVQRVVTHWITLHTKDGKKTDIPRQAMEDANEDPYLDTDFPNSVRTQEAYFVNAFVEDSTKPQVVRFPKGVARKIRDLIPLNENEELSHPEKGCTVHVKFDKSAPSAAAMYSVQKGDRSPLSKKQKKARLHDLSVLVSPPKKKDAMKDAAELAQRAHPPKEEKDAEAKPRKSKGKHGKGDKRKGRKSK